ncbi:MAG: hypothetical protein V3576_01000 [Candidatus Cloacimonadota bacterium]
MKALIVLYSKTNHTKGFAEKIAQQIRSNGHEADIHLLETVIPVPDNMNPTSMDFELKPVPDVAVYDYLLVGTPVWAFRSAPFVLKYLSGLGSLKGKKVIPFVTMGFPWAFLGGTAAVSKIANLALSKGAIPLKGSVVTYMLSKPQEIMEREAQRIGQSIR